MRLLGPLLRSARQILRAAILLCALGAVTSASGAGSYGPDVTTSYGYAVFGDLKYGPGFTHLDYTNPDAPKGGSYRYSGGRTFDSLNQFSILGTFPWLTLHLYDPLMERALDEPASYYGVIAKTITYPSDYSWVEFELRPEARWHDGRPITVEDVIFTIELMRNNLVNPRYGAAARVVSKAYQTGPHRVRMELNQRNNPTLPATVAGMKVLPKHYYEGKDLGQPSLEIPVTGGAYRIGEVVPGRAFELVRVKNYWGANLPMRKGRYNFDRIRHIFYRDVGTQLEAFNAGLIDFKFESSALRWEAEESMPAFVSGDIQRNNIPYSSGAYYSSMTINSRRPFLSDRRVRHALMLAYDFEFVRDVILHGDHGRTVSHFTNLPFAATGLPTPGELKFLEPYRGSLPPEIFTRELTVPVGGSRKRQRENLKQARDLLAEAGYHIKDMKLIDPRTGKPVTLELITPSPLYLRNVGYFIKNMERLGIEVNYRSFDTAQFRYLAGTHRFDLMIDLPVFPTSDTPGPELRSAWSSEGARTPNTLNYAGVREPAIDNAIEAIIGASDHQTVVDGMRAIDRVARANYYSIPFQHTYPAPVGEMPVTYWNKFGRPDKDPTYNFPFTTLDYWWWDAEKEAKLSHGVYK